MDSQRITTNTPIPPTVRVRYIKLGVGGKWEKECLTNGVIRFGFGSATAKRFPLCCAHNWNQLRKDILSDPRMTEGVATRFTNETQKFFEDNGTTLWITFGEEQLWWGFLTTDPSVRHTDGNGVQRTVNGGWKNADLNGEKLTKDNLSGALVKLAAYRGTSCDVDVADYVIRRINGLTIPQVERAIAALTTMKSSVLEIMRLLGDRDFEILVDLVFTSSGWRRVGVVGKTQKTLDLDLELPSTGERAFVQVKSKTTTSELADYVNRFEGNALHERMFYVFHSGEAQTANKRVKVIGPEKLAELVVEAGLAGWLIRKVS